jgi:hypothetical protein
VTARGLRSRPWALAVALLLCACDLIADATPAPSDPAGTPAECPGALLEGELIRDDASGFLVRHAEGFVTPIVWPAGYTVRDADARELLDPSGAVVAREGDEVALGGGFTEGDTAFIVCGPFEVIR